MDDVLPVDRDVVEQAKQLALSSYRLSARDAVHVSVMRRAGIRTVMTFDAGFDIYPGIERLR